MQPKIRLQLQAEMHSRRSDAHESLCALGEIVPMNNRVDDDSQRLGIDQNHFLARLQTLLARSGLERQLFLCAVEYVKLGVEGATRKVRRHDEQGREYDGTSRFTVADAAFRPLEERAVVSATRSHGYRIS